MKFSQSYIICGFGGWPSASLLPGQVHICVFYLLLNKCVRSCVYYVSISLMKLHNTCSVFTGITKSSIFETSTPKLYCPNWFAITYSLWLKSVMKISYPCEQYQLYSHKRMAKTAVQNCRHKPLSKLKYLYFRTMLLGSSSNCDYHWSSQTSITQNSNSKKIKNGWVAEMISFGQPMTICKEQPLDID